MKYIVCFCSDRKIIEIDESSCKFTEPYSFYSLNDWKNLPIQTVVDLQCYYEGKERDCVLLQVVPDLSEDTTATILRLRTIQFEKKKSAISMARICKTRVGDKRIRFENVIQTSADESRTETSDSELPTSHSTPHRYHRQLQRLPTPPPCSKFKENGNGIAIHQNDVDEIKESIMRVERKQDQILEFIRERCQENYNLRSQSSSSKKNIPSAKTESELEEIFDSCSKEEIAQHLVNIQKLTLTSTIHQMLLRLASAKVWKNYSRDGKRGKKSATKLGLVQVLTAAIAQQQSKEESKLFPKVTKKLIDALKRMPTTEKRSSAIGGLHHQRTESDIESGSETVVEDETFSSTV